MAQGLTPLILHLCTKPREQEGQKAMLLIEQYVFQEIVDLVAKDFIQILEFPMFENSDQKTLYPINHWSVQWRSLQSE